MKTYCLMCMTGHESKVVRIVNRCAPELTILSPVRILPEKLGGQWRNREKALLPGYLFLYTDLEDQPRIRQMSHRFYKYLSYELGSRELFGNDKTYAEWILAHQGQLQPSLIFATGDQISVLDGPLADRIGTIVKLDRHKRRAWIQFEFDGQQRMVCLGAEFLERLDVEAERRVSDLLITTTSIGAHNKNSALTIA